MVLKYVHDITRNNCNRNQEKQDLLRQLKCLTDSDHDYILEEVEHRDKNLYRINVSLEDEEEEFNIFLSEFFISWI